MAVITREVLQPFIDEWLGVVSKYTTIKTEIDSLNTKYPYEMRSNHNKYVGFDIEECSRSLFQDILQNFLYSYYPKEIVRGALVYWELIEVNYDDTKSPYSIFSTEENTTTFIAKLNAALLEELMDEVNSVGYTQERDTYIFSVYVPYHFVDRLNRFDDVFKYLAGKLDSKDFVHITDVFTVKDRNIVKESTFFLINRGKGDMVYLTVKDKELGDKFVALAGRNKK